MAHFTYSTTLMHGGGRIDCRLCERSIIVPGRRMGQRGGFFVQVLDDIGRFVDARGLTWLHQCEREALMGWRCEICEVDYPQAGALAWNMARRGRSWRPKCPDCNSQLSIGVLALSPSPQD